MKIKSISSFGLLAIGTVLFITLNSSSGGINGVATSGCGGGGCHGNSASSNTTVTFSGLPVTGYITNTAYQCTLTVTNSSKVKAGFDLVVSDGTITSVGSGIAIQNSKEVRHSTPNTMASGVCNFIFNWTAPAHKNGVTFAFAGNAVNDNGGESGDEWNKGTVAVTGNFAAAVQDFEANGFSMYPNPAVNSVSIKSSEKAITAIKVISFLGQEVLFNQLPSNTHDTQLDIRALSTGNYILKVQSDNQWYTNTISKQ
ncbi:MAG: choice-of-anchor V domain-containing protein [Chitinophagaceae bacterium]